jgi:hypothetical protein
LRTYSDYKDLSISSFKNIQYHWYEKVLLLF